MIAYESQVDLVEHIALVKGDVGGDPVLVRMHAVDAIGDLLGGSPSASLRGAMTAISACQRGVVVLLRDADPAAVSAHIRELAEGRRPERALRDYGIGAQILIDLGVRDMILLSNHKRTIIGLEGFGLNIVEQRGIDGAKP